MLQSGRPSFQDIFLQSIKKKKAFIKCDTVLHLYRYIKAKQECVCLCVCVPTHYVLLNISCVRVCV